MIKLKLNWFGGPAAEQLDSADGKTDNAYNFTYNNNRYSIPQASLNSAIPDDILVSNKDKADAVKAYVRYYISTNGNPGTKEDFIEWAGNNSVYVPANTAIWYQKLSSDTFKTSLDSAITSATPVTPGGTTGLTPPGTTSGTTSGTTNTTGVNVDEARLGAFNEYYQDVYSLAPGTGGANMLNRLEQSYMNQAQQAATIADVGFQQAALQQAQTVKQITDQVRAERMARLRAGMSESQIANQDMQMLMANVNTLNQNAQMLNQQRLEAQIGMNTAQDQAYADFLTQANQRGQVASAMAAADAGDAYQQTIRRMSTLYGSDPTKWNSTDFTREYNITTTGNPAGSTNR